MAEFQEQIQEFTDQEITVIAASVDNEEDTKKMTLKESFTFPVAYGVNALEVAKNTGAFYDEKREFLHATGFILKPDGTVATAVYASGPVGRLIPADSLRMIHYYRRVEAKKTE